MTYNEIMNIAKKLDKEIRQEIELAVEERIEILRQGDLTEEEMAKMEECLYMSLILQEYLDGEYEFLDEEREVLMAEMEEMYNEYGDLLTKARLEEKVSTKKRMAMNLMRIRESLLASSNKAKRVKSRMAQNRENHDVLKALSSKDSMRSVVKNQPKDVVHKKDRGLNLGMESDFGIIASRGHSTSRDMPRQEPHRETTKVVVSTTTVEVSSAISSKELNANTIVKHTNKVIERVSVINAQNTGPSHQVSNEGSKIGEMGATNIRNALR